MGAAFRMFRSAITCMTGANNPSTTCNLLFGNLQHPYQVYSWAPVHVSAGDGLNSWPGDKLQQGATDLVPDNLSITVSIGYFSGSARFQFLSSRFKLEFAAAVPLHAYDAKAVRPTGALPQPERSSSFSDSSRPVFCIPLGHGGRAVHAPSWPDTGLCATGADLAG